MNDIKTRLLEAQANMVEALDIEEHERLPSIVAERQADLEALVAVLQGDPELRAWARDYLERDRDIMARAIVVRDAVASKLASVRQSQAVHRIYISEGLRR